MAKLTQQSIGGVIPASVWELETATASQVDACCGLGKGVNLLDNWYFGPGVINQRGQTSYLNPNGGYFIDRWYKGAYSLTLGNEGLVVNNNSGVNNYMNQYIETVPPKGVPVTGSFLINSSILISATAPWGTVVTQAFPKLGLSINVGKHTSKGYYYLLLHLTPGVEYIINAAKLELGTEQTLAVPDGNGGWILADPPPNPALELLKCQRYLYAVPSSPLDTSGYPGSAEVGTPSNINTMIYLPVSMFATPTIIGDSTLYCKPGGQSVTVSSLTMNNSLNIAVLKSTGVSGTTAGQVLFLNPRQGFYLSCEL